MFTAMETVTRMWRVWMKALEEIEQIHDDYCTATGRKITRDRLCYEANKEDPYRPMPIAKIMFGVFYPKESFEKSNQYFAKKDQEE
jgi:hypothetical protein